MPYLSPGQTYFLLNLGEKQIWRDVNYAITLQVINSLAVYPFQIIRTLVEHANVYYIMRLTMVKVVGLGEDKENV
jgi:hypothetical protein